MPPEPAVPSSRAPLQAFTAMILLTCAALSWIAWKGWDTNRSLDKARKDQLEIEQLRGSILLMDEVLTMSARMAAGTGDLSWEARYRTYESQLDAAIKRAGRFTPSLSSNAAVSETAAANTALVAMENDSFRLSREGRKDEAENILNSAEYAKQKQIYAKAMVQLASDLDATSGAISRNQEEAYGKTSVILCTLVPALLAAWLLCLQIFKRWHRLLLEQNAKINEHTTELLQLNASLDRRVAERSRELERSKQAALNMMQDAYESRQELAGMQAQLVQAEKLSALGRFATGLAHEVKNPLAIILSWTEVLQRKIHGDDTEGKEALEKIISSVERADKVIRGLLQFSRPAKLKLEKVRVREIVGEAIALIEQKLKLSNIAFKNEPEQQDLWIRGDKNQLQQVLFNLLSNSMDAMRSGGSITLSTAVQQAGSDGAGRSCALSIIDTGEGISPENLSKIFEPFFTTKRDRGGTGLGLPVCKGIVENHGGTLSFQSEQGKGTVVKLVLPLA